MNLTDKQKEVLELAITKYGRDAQVDMAIEELAELIVELTKYKRGRPCDIYDEVADVYIMLRQVQLIIFDNFDGVQNRIDFKIERLQKRLES